MTHLPSTLRVAIQDASVPELKDVLRRISERFEGGKELVERLTSELRNKERNGRDELGSVVRKICVEFETCRGVVEEVLCGDGEEVEMNRRGKVKRILDGSDEDGDLSETESLLDLAKLRGKKRKLGSPEKWKGRTMIKIGCNTIKRNGIDRPGKKNQPPPTASTLKKNAAISSLRSIHPLGQKPADFITAVKESSKATLDSIPERMKTAAEYFAADEKRRAREVLEKEDLEKQLRSRGGVYMAPGLAKCARCTQYYEKAENEKDSCIFHAGKSEMTRLINRKFWPDSRYLGFQRHYHPSIYHIYNYRWYCCGRDESTGGCQKARHIDDQIPGEIERQESIRTAARIAAERVLFKQCGKCTRDVFVELNQNDSDSEHEDSGDEDSENEELGLEEKRHEELEHESLGHQGLGPENSRHKSTEHGDPEADDLGLANSEHEVPNDEDPDDDDPEEYVPLHQASLPKKINSRRFLCSSCKLYEASTNHRCRRCDLEFEVSPDVDFDPDQRFCSDCLCEAWIECQCGNDLGGPCWVDERPWCKDCESGDGDEDEVLSEGEGEGVRVS